MYCGSINYNNQEHPRTQGNSQATDQAPARLDATFGRRRFQASGVTPPRLTRIHTQIHKHLEKQDGVDMCGVQRCEPHVLLSPMTSKSMPNIVVYHLQTREMA